MMRSSWRGRVVVLALLSFPVVAQGSTPAWATEGPVLARATDSFSVPLTVFASKIYVRVMMGGKPRRFVVDTGSPSMLDTAVAKELGLKVVGKSEGRDSHGARIVSNIVQGAVTVGSVEFRNVPMFCADFSTAAATRTFLGDGVLGSELLRLGAWQFDLRDKKLRFSTDPKVLPGIAEGTKIKLYSFGYPHAPIVDVRFAKRATSKAMFDTGSPTVFAVSPADFIGASKHGGVGGRILGFGSAGASLGGQAKGAEHVQIELKTLSIGGVDLGPVRAIRRESSPSLLGFRILQQFIVTLDSRSGAAYLRRYAKRAAPRSTFGFTPAFDEGISVALVWDGSPAHRAGLRAGKKLKSINGVATELSTPGIRRVMAAMAGPSIKLTWEGGSVKIDREVPQFR